MFQTTDQQKIIDLPKNARNSMAESFVHETWEHVWKGCSPCLGCVDITLFLQSSTWRLILDTTKKDNSNTGVAEKFQPINPN